MHLGPRGRSRRLAALVPALAICLLAAVLGVTGPTTAQADPDPAPPRLARGTGDGVTVSAAVLRSARVGDAFVLDLPGGPATAKVEYRQEQGGFTGWAGSAGDGSFYAIVNPDGSVRVDVDLADGVYTLEEGERGYVGRLHRRPAHGGEDDAVVPPVQAPLTTDRDADTADAEAAGRTHWIRVLMVYSTQVRKSLGLKKVKVLARSGINQTNAAFKNSKINVRLKLVGVKKAGRERPRKMLANLKSLWKRDGRFDKVPKLRNRKKADLVQMIVKTGDPGGYCGYGYLRPPARYAYSITTAACAVKSKGTAHELGHNLGADHDATAGYQPTSKLPARGYVNVKRRWVTVMAYWTKCQKKGVYCRKIPYFSNPKVKLNGARTGKFGKADNHVVINRRAPKVKKFRR